MIVAAGRSRRFGRDKLWRKLGSRPVIAHTLAAFQRCPAIDAILLVVNPTSHARFEKLKAKNSKLKTLVVGGAERQFSVFNGLRALPRTVQIVLIHDAARPCVTPKLISACVGAAKKYGAAIAAAPIADTVKETRSFPRIARTLDRTKLWAAQTPQAFRADLIRRAYARVIAKKLLITDDAAAVEILGKPVHLVHSDSTNLKITRPADLELARQILRRR